MHCLMRASRMVVTVEQTSFAVPVVSEQLLFTQHWQSSESQLRMYVLPTASMAWSVHDMSGLKSACWKEHGLMPGGAVQAEVV